MENGQFYSIRAYRTRKCKGKFTIEEDQLTAKIESIEGFYESYKKPIIFCLLFIWLIVPIVLLLLMLYRYEVNISPCKTRANFSIKMSDIKEIESRDRLMLGKHLWIRSKTGKNYHVFFYDPMDHIRAAKEITRILDT